MKRKNIVFVVFEPHFSGQGRAVVDICTHSTSDCNFFLICQESNGTLHEYCRVLVQASLPVKISKTFNRDIFRALRFLHSNNIDIIHLHGFEGLLWGHALAILAGIPLVFTPHTIDMKNRFFFFFYRIPWRILSLYTSMLITVSEEDRKTMIRRKTISKKKVRTILLGIDHERFDKIDSVKPQIEGAGDKRWIVQVGHLSYQKNPFCFVHGASLLLRKFSDLCFFLVGEGPLSDELHLYINHMGLCNSVHLLGYRDDAVDITKHAYIVTNTSRWEGMPFTLIDACFLAKPIVAAAVNGIKDLIIEGSSGLLFRPDDAGEFAQKVHILLSHETLSRELGNNAYKRVNTKFRPQTMAYKHCELYNSVMSNSH